MATTLSGETAARRVRGWACLWLAAGSLGLALGAQVALLLLRAWGGRR